MNRIETATFSIRLSTALTLLVVLASATAGWSADPATEQRIATDGKKPLVVCAVPNSMPRTGQATDGTPLGLDVAVVQLLAKKLDRKIEFHWCVSAQCSWKCVRERRCDIVIGQPHGSGPSREIAWSIPYAGSRFGLVVHRKTNSIHSHADLTGKRVGVVTGTVSVASKEHTTVQFKTRKQLLDEFVEKKLDAAFVDSDFAAWHLHQHTKLPLKLVAEYVPRERWNMGFAVRTRDVSLLKEINRALTHIVLTGKVSKAFSSQGVSYRAPYSKTDGRPLGYNAWKRIRERGEMVVSMDPANLPYSSAKTDRPGFDVELARELAKKLDVKLKIDWIDIQRETAIGQLVEVECDLAFGVAIEPNAVDDEQEIAGKVIYSQPYYGTGYLLVTRKDGPTAKSLAELKGKKSRRIGTEAGSVADYHLRQKGYLRRLFRTQLSVLKALDDGQIDYGYLWANVGWTLHASPEFKLELVPNYIPEDHWNIAIAMRRGDDELKQHIDAAIAKLIEDGTVSRLSTSYYLPYFPVFKNDKKAVSNSGLQKNGSKLTPVAQQNSTIRRQRTDRGLEPQTYRRQRSKNQYSTLERIRSTGVLVVGLDQNALPFSTAHPKPSGLDYEIAGLLAKKLDLSLKVYWAYSSHDSYPSKLATKKFCDVVLGVMPDDRFGKRVMFSKPYYFADYRFVVLGDAAGPNIKTSLAVERGIAVRGIRERQTQEYPSLESILEAVVTGKEQAGYVISARGQWLAEKRWPNKLKFVRNNSNTVDRFPICAAVRKSDGELGRAINLAFGELAQSGKLAEVFARWNIPYSPPKSSPKNLSK